MGPQDPVILSFARTPFGRFGGGLRDLSAVDLGVVASRAAMERAKSRVLSSATCIRPGQA